MTHPIASHSTPDETASDSIPTRRPQWITVVEDSVRNLRFGVVQIIVHHAKVVQIERTEETRLDISPTGLNS